MPHRAVARIMPHTKYPAFYALLLGVAYFRLNIDYFASLLRPADPKVHFAL